MTQTTRPVDSPPQADAAPLMSTLPSWQGPRPASATTAMMRYDANKKSLLVAYILWFFLGYLGAHRFYLRRPLSATLMLLLSIGCTIVTLVTLGLLGAVFAVVFLWWLLDAILIPGLAARFNNRLIATLTA